MYSFLTCVIEFAYSMEKVNKIMLFYNIENAQVIQVMVNIGDITYALASPITTSPTLTPSLIPTTETSTSILEVD